ncbi:MAG: hypothetical protein N2505_06440 [Endomicrobia bacterium]|nr:hypothetical protein [Endomicrobiia bacterium]
MKKTNYIITLTLILFTNLTNATTKVTPIINISLLGGQNIFEKETSGFSGYLDSNISVPISFGNFSTLLPMLNLKYVGFKEVQELLGGGTLYQETFDTMLLLKLIQHIYGGVYIKPKIVLKSEAIKETKDETWLNGLYNYNRGTFGIELSKDFAKKNYLTTGINFSKITFPNYTSLAYETKDTFGIEITTNVGKNPLDYTSTHIYIEDELNLNENTKLKFAINLNNKNFLEQKIVVDGPQYSDEKRKDQTFYITLGINYVSKHFKASVAYIGAEFTFVSNDSNQNHFFVDPNYPAFIKDYYDYRGSIIKIPINYIFTLKGKTAIIGATVVTETKNYINRPIQDKNTGEFLEEKVRIVQNSTTIFFEYKLNANFSLKLLTNSYSSFSTMEFEKLYKYNYEGMYYLLGINYRY